MPHWKEEEMVMCRENEFSTNGNVGVKATMVSRCGPMVKTNDMVMVFCHTNSEWRITYWDVDE